MAMDQAAAERWVTISAAGVAAIYAYRRLIEPASQGKIKNVLGVGAPVPLGQFATAWGFTFLVVAIMASASPQLGGSFAILILTGDALANTQSIVSDVTKQESAQASSAKTSAAGVAANDTAATTHSPVQSGVSSVLGATDVGVGSIGTTVSTGGTHG